MTATPLQEALLDELPELQDYEKVTYHLFNELCVQEDHVQFWMRALHIYCLEKGVLGACKADIYRDFTFPFVIPGDTNALQPEEPFSHSTVKVYPESLETCLRRLRLSKDILSGDDLNLLDVDGICKNSGVGGWIGSAITTVLGTWSPKKDTSAIGAICDDTPLIPASILQEISKIVIRQVQKLAIEDSSEHCYQLVYYLHNPEADQLYEKSLSETDEDLRPGPMTITSLLKCVDSLINKELGLEGSCANTSDVKKTKDNTDNTKTLFLFRKLVRDGISHMNVSGNNREIRLEDVLVAYMVSNGMATLSDDHSVVRLIPADSPPAGKASASTEGSLISASKAPQKFSSASCDQWGTAFLSLQYTLYSLRQLTRRTERRIEQKTSIARKYVLKAREAEKSGNAASQEILTKMAKIHLSLRSQLQSQYDSAANAMMKLEGVLLTMNTSEVQQIVLDSIHNATVTLKGLREGDKFGNGRIMITAEEAEQILDSADEELEENRLWTNEIAELMSESVQRGMGACTMSAEEDLEQELADLMQGVSITQTATAPTDVISSETTDPEIEKKKVFVSDLPGAPPDPSSMTIETKNMAPQDEHHEKKVTATVSA